MPTRRILLLALVVAACGGDVASPPPPPPPPPPPAPVARVAVTPGSADLVPAETAQLTATALDAADNPLAGRAISWESTAPAVATVSGTGLVTAVGPGAADITASSEGKSSSARITVRQGGYVGSTGGTITSGDNKVRMVVPAGAVQAGTAVTITPTSTPPAPAAATHAVSGTTYVFGPEGTQFRAPVTVTIDYDAAALPSWVVPGDLVLQRWDGTSWSTLSDLVVDPEAGTVTGKTPGFSTVGVYFRNPVVTVTPAPGKVSAVQRSVLLEVDVSGEGRNPDAVRIEWSHTGENGTLNSPSGRTIQYTALTPILPPGDLDGISVVVKGQFEPDGPFEVLGEAQTTVRAELDMIIRLQPERAVVQFSGTAQLEAEVLDRVGNQRYDSRDLLYSWTGTANAGTFSPLGERTGTGTVTYTAKQASQQSATGPRGDKVTVVVTLMTNEITPLLGGQFKRELVFTELGAAEGFVQVVPQYTVSLVPEGATLNAGQSAAFSVKLDPAWQEGEQLFFRWRRTGSQGNINLAQGVPLTQNSVTYTANSNPPGGTDFIDVEVLVGMIGVLGSARASVSVSERTSQVHGSLFITPPIPADEGRSCIHSYIQFPLVADAKSYEMHAYGFNDTAFWGTNIDETFTTPLLPLPTFGPASGANGGNYYFYLTGGCGRNAVISTSIANINARFAGMTVDVDVRF